MRYSKNHNIHKKVNKNSTKNRMRITKKKSKQKHLRNTKNGGNRRKVNKSIKYGGMEANSTTAEDLLRTSTDQDTITIELKTENETVDIVVNRTDKVFTAIRNALNLQQNHNITVLFGMNQRVEGEDESFESFGIEDNATLSVIDVKVTLNIYLSVGMGFGARSLNHRYHITLINVPIDTYLTREDFLKINGWPRREIAIRDNNIHQGDNEITLPNELDMIDEEDFRTHGVFIDDADDSTPFYNTTIDSVNDIIYIGQGTSTGRTKGFGSELPIQEITLDYENRDT